MPETIAATLQLDTSQASQSIGEVNKDLQQTGKELTNVEQGFQETSKEAKEAAGNINKVDAAVKTTTKTVSSYRAEIKQATQELKDAIEKEGQFSQAALDAAKKLGTLKNEMADASKLANQFNTDGNAGLQAFGNAVRGVAGGFAAAQGAMALFGGESEEVQKTLLKVQAALALSEGLNNIGELSKSFNTLGAILKGNVVVQGLYTFATTGRIKATVAATVATEAETVAQVENNVVGEAAVVVEGEQAIALEAQTVATVTATTATTGMTVAMTVLRTALIATGIGALIILLIAAYQAFEQFANGAEEAAKKQEELNKKTVEYANIGLEANTKAAKRDTEAAVARAKASGASADEIFKIQKDGLQRQAKALESHYKEVAGIDQEAAFKDAETLKDLQHDADLLNATHTEEGREKYKKYLSDKYNLSIEDNKRQEALDINKAKLADKNESAIYQIQHDAQTERLKQLIEYQNKSIGLGEDYYNAAKKQVHDAQAALTKFESDEEVTRFNNLKAILDKTKKLVLDNKNVSGADIQQIITDQYNKTHHLGESGVINPQLQGLPQLQGGIQTQDQKDIIKQNQNDALDAASKGYADQLDAIDRFHVEQFEKIKGNKEAELALEDDVSRQKKKIAQDEKDFKLGMVASFADQAADIVGRDTVAGKAFAITSAVINTYLAATVALKSSPPPFNFISMGLTIAAGLKAVANIVSTPVPGKGSGGGSVPTNSFSVPSAPLQPVTPQQSNTTLNQDQLNQIGNATVRAFVVEADVANNAEKVARLNRAARLGG